MKFNNITYTIEQGILLRDKYIQKFIGITIDKLLVISILIGVLDYIFNRYIK